MPETNSAENGNKSFPIEMEDDDNQFYCRRKMYKRGNSNNNILISSLLKEKVDKKNVDKSIRVRNSNKKVTFSLNGKKATNSEGDVTQSPSLNIRNRRKRSASTSKTTLANHSVCSAGKVTNVISENNNGVKKKTPDNLTSNQTARCFEPSKYSEPFISESIVRELEVTESTPTFIPDDINEMDSGPCVSAQRREEKTVTLEYLKNGLDEWSGVLLRTAHGFNANCYLCTKCNKSFKRIKSAAHHYYLCKSFFKGNETIACKDLLFICLKCLFFSSEYNKLMFHKKSCSPSVNGTISNYIRHYRKVDKHVCDKCCFSCISDYTFSRHDCEKILGRMKTCGVVVKKLTTTDLNTFGGLSKFECPTCEGIFYDELSFEKHSEVHLMKGVKNAKSFIKQGRTFVRKAKRKLIKNAKVYESAQEILKEFVEPFSEIELTNDQQNTDCLNRDLIDATLPYQNQVLLKQAAKPFFDQEINSMGKELGMSSLEDETNPESHLHPPDAVSSLRNFKCQCKKISVHPPKKETKPCLKCLNKFMLACISTESTESQTSIHNSSASVISDHLNQQAIPRIASLSGSATLSNLENFTASDFNMVKMLTAVDVEQSEIELNASLNPSADIAIPGNIIIHDHFLQNKVVLDGLNNACDISKQDAGDTAEKSVNECHTGMSWRVSSSQAKGETHQPTDTKVNGQNKTRDKKKRIN